MTDLLPLTSGAVRDRNPELRRMYLELEQELAEAQDDKDSREIARITDLMRNRVGAEFFSINQGLAFDIAKQFFAPTSTHAEDYVQDAFAGLWRAFLKWNPDKGTFGTWSRSFISGATQRGVRTLEFTEISHSDFSHRKHVVDAERKLERKLGRRPSDEEVQKETGFTLSLIRRVRQGRVVSLDTPIGEDNGSTLGDVVADKHTMALTGYSGSDDALWLEHVIKVTEGLSAAELAILVRRNGWDSAPSQSLVDVAAVTGYGRGTVSRLENRALAGVRKHGAVPVALE